MNEVNDLKWFRRLVVRRDPREAWEDSLSPGKEGEIINSPFFFFCFLLQISCKLLQIFLYNGRNLQYIKKCL